MGRVPARPVLFSVFGYNHAVMKMLGRTNRALFPLWIRGGLPESGVPDINGGRSLLRAAVDNGVEVFDLTVSPGYWGDVFRQTQSPLMISALSRGIPLHLTPDTRAAGKLIQAHLIEVLCAAGRERCDFYFLACEYPLQEFQTAGALEALEIARQEGQIGYLGLAVYAKPLQTLSFWKMHDAFEVLLIPGGAEEQTLSTLLPEAAARRAGVVLEYEGAGNEDDMVELRVVPGIHALLLTARSAETIRAAARRTIEEWMGIDGAGSPDFPKSEPIK